MSHFDQPSLSAGGVIRPFRFIKIGLGADSQGNEADAGELTIGITTGGSREAPQDGAVSNAAAAGDTFEWRSAGAVTLLKADATGWTRNDLLMSDSDGKGDVAEDGNFVGAQALQTVAANEIGEVLVLSPFFLENT